LPVMASITFTMPVMPLDGFVTLSAFSYGECSGQQASCGGGCRGPPPHHTVMGCTPIGSVAIYGYVYDMKNGQLVEVT